MNRAASLLSLVWKTSLLVSSSAFLMKFCLYDVDAGERALMFDRFQGGIRDVVIGEGTHFYNPAIQYPIIMDIRTSARKIRSSTASKDQQTVNIVLRLLYKPDPLQLPHIYKNVGIEWADNIFSSVGNEVLTSVVAQYDAVEMITQRERVSQSIRDQLTERCGIYNILLDDVAITDLTFSNEYTSAIERKQLAQQDAERSRYLVEKAKQEAEAQVIRAQGETEAAELITKSATPGFIQLRRLEAAREIAETLSNSPNIIYFPSGSTILLSPTTTTLNTRTQ